LKTNCEECTYYVYDDEAGDYFCDANLSEDEMARLVSYSNYECQYYSNYDEYAIVKRQM